MTQDHSPTVFLVDDSADVRASLSRLIAMSGLAVETYACAEDFLAAYSTERPGCLLLDLKMPGMSGTDLQTELGKRGIGLPIIFLTAHGDIPTTVRAIQAGAVDFLTKPVQSQQLLERIQAAIVQDVKRHERMKAEREHATGLAALTTREMEVATLLVTGCSNKEVARKLGISHRTVEAHRARIFDKTRADNLIELAALLGRFTVGSGSTD